MTTSLSTIHHKRFEEIRKSLSLLGNKEANFLQVQLLFYEVLTIAKDYGANDSNTLLEHLRQLEQNEYKNAIALTAKQNQKENNIRHFIINLKKILSAY
jgi:hypothetical protein